MEQQDVNYHAMTASSPSRAMTAATTTNTAAMGEQRTGESIARTPQPPPTSVSNIHEYFQPVFEEINKLNKTLDSLIEWENDKAREKKK